MVETATEDWTKLVSEDWPRLIEDKTLIDDVKNALQRLGELTGSIGPNQDSAPILEEDEKKALSELKKVFNKIYTRIKENEMPKLEEKLDDVETSLHVFDAHHDNNSKGFEARSHDASEQEQYIKGLDKGNKDRYNKLSPEKRAEELYISLEEDEYQKLEDNIHLVKRAIQEITDRVTSLVLGWQQMDSLLGRSVPDNPGRPDTPDNGDSPSSSSGRPPAPPAANQLLLIRARDIEGAVSSLNPDVHRKCKSAGTKPPEKWKPIKVALSDFTIPQADRKGVAVSYNEKRDIATLLVRVKRKFLEKQKKIVVDNNYDSISLSVQVPEWSKQDKDAVTELERAIETKGIVKFHAQNELAKTEKRVETPPSRRPLRR